MSPTPAAEESAKRAALLRPKFGQIYTELDATRDDAAERIISRTLSASEAALLRPKFAELHRHLRQGRDNEAEHLVARVLAK